MIRVKTERFTLFDVIYNLSNETKVFTAKMQLWVLNAQKSDLHLFSMLISLFGI